MTKTFHEINFSPYATNVLDVIGENLTTAAGNTIQVKHGMRGFQIYRNGELMTETDDNLHASYILNTMQAGRNG